MKGVKIVLVDDHALFRNGLKGLISMREGYEVVAEAGDGGEFLDMLPTLEADVVFMDISMPNVGGEEATRKALSLCPDLKIVTLSMFGEESYYTRMVEAGAKGFLLKDSSIEEVFEAIDTVAAGGDYFSQRLLSSMSNRLRGTELSSGELSSREIEILLAICRGLSNQEIAEELFISKRTVDAHRANILEKTGCKNTASLVVYAIRNRLVEL
ncbi:MAG: response regulator transcription factor [Alistipes sp.]|nr:response regulator transcription factor [Alistipes sp.]